MISCDPEGDDGDTENPFVGTWTGTAVAGPASGDANIVFTANNSWTFKFTNVLMTEAGSYTWEGETVTFRRLNLVVGTGTLSGSTLTLNLSALDPAITGTFTKVVPPSAPTANAPSITSAVPGGLAGNIQISWDAPSGITPMFYNIYRSTSVDGPFNPITPGGYTLGSIRTYIDTGLTTGTQYYYKVEAEYLGSVKGTQSAASSAVTAP